MDTLVSTAGGAVASASSTAPTGAYDYWCDGNGVVHVGVAGMYLVVGIETASGTVPPGSAWLTIGKSLATSLGPSDPAGFQVAARTALANIAFASSIVVWQGYLNVGDWVDTGIIIGTAYTLNQVTANNANTDPYVPALHISRLSAGLQGPAGATGPQGPDVTLTQSSYYYGVATPTGSGNLTSGAWNYASWSTVMATNLTLPNVQQVTFGQTGKYLVNVQIGLYPSSAAVTRSDMLIDHRAAGGAIKQQRRIMGNWGNTGSNFNAQGAAVLDVVAGDYVMVAVNPNAAGCQFDYGGQYSWIEITPVGGAKGDPGAAGPPGGTYDGFIRRSGLSGDTTIAMTSGANNIALPTVVSTQGATYTPNAGNTTFAVPAAGTFTMTAVASLTSAGVNGAWWVAVTVNGNVVVREFGQNTTGANAYETVETTCERYLNAGDQVGLLVYFPAAGTLRSLDHDVTTDPMSPTLSVWRTSAGVQGPTGLTGATGATGPAGTGPGFNPRGEWVSATAYNANDIVTKSGVAYLAMQASTGVDPGLIPTTSYSAVTDIAAQLANVGKTVNFYPTWRQGGVILPYNLAHAWYTRVGEWVLIYVSVAFTGAGAAANLSMDLPVPMRATNYAFNSLPGSAFIYNGSNNYGMWATGGPAGPAPVIYIALGTNYYGTAIANGHSVSGAFMYPAPIGA
jgi:hypothetical protein